jgi:hypothetical protein
LAKGVKSLKDYYKDNSKVLESGTKDTLDYYEALGGLKD